MSGAGKSRGRGWARAAVGAEINHMARRTYLGHLVVALPLLGSYSLLIFRPARSTATTSREQVRTGQGRRITRIKSLPSTKSKNNQVYCKTRLAMWSFSAPISRLAGLLHLSFDDKKREKGGSIWQRHGRQRVAIRPLAQINSSRFDVA